MADVINLTTDINKNIIEDDSRPALTLDNSSTAGIQAHGLRVSKRAGGNTSIAPIELVPSGNASAPVLEIERAGFASITSVVLTTVANTDYAIRVNINGARWIPAFKDAGIIGAAAFTDNGEQA